jgi:hypothetical protein
VQPGETVPGRLASLDDPSLSGLPDLREGYPWFVPHHRLYGASRGPGSGIESLGLRWQSLIVSTRQLEWMKPPVVPDDSKFAWWKRLRQVNTSWVASRGEAERFLYYDGPTHACTPVHVTLNGAQLVFDIRKPFERRERGLSKGYEWLIVVSMRQTGCDAANYERRRGLLVTVDEGVASGQVVEVPKQSGTVRLDGSGPLDAAGLRKALRTIIEEQGLTPEETAGFMDCWDADFFKADGRRFLTVLSAADYDELCPLRARPAPTEVVRVGVVLTELHK